MSLDAVAGWAPQNGEVSYRCSSGRTLRKGRQAFLKNIVWRDWTHGLPGVGSTSHKTLDHTKKHSNRESCTLHTPMATRNAMEREPSFKCFLFLFLWRWNSPFLGASPQEALDLGYALERKVQGR